MVMEIRQSGEDYLEAILMLKNKNGYVRSIDIANKFGYSKASVSKAMSILRQNNYIVMDTSGQIHLTQKGYDKASSVYERHKLITKFLVMTLEVNEKIAEEDACRIEHVISQESFERLKKFVERNS